jgi:post-segregation antitoxin (ccd killing protein)
MEKRPANLSISADVLAPARELDIALSATPGPAMAAYNADVEREGVFSDGLRSF